MRIDFFFFHSCVRVCFSFLNQSHCIVLCHCCLRIVPVRPSKPCSRTLEAFKVKLLMVLLRFLSFFFLFFLFLSDRILGAVFTFTCVFVQSVEMTFCPKRLHTPTVYGGTKHEITGEEKDKKSISQ